MAKKNNTKKEYPFNVKVRSIPRNQYGHCNTDPLLRYMYKYNFDRYCTGFLVVDKETKKQTKFNTILDLINFLTQPNQLFKDGVPDTGIPIVTEGMLCAHAPELDQDEQLDPYFSCTIIVDYLGTADKVREGTINTYFFKP